MKQILKHALSATLLLSSVNSFADCQSDCNPCNTYCGPRTNLLLRSQGANTARELVGWQYEINRPDMCENYSSAYYAVEYSRTFNSSSLAQSLFGSDILSFKGSQVIGRNNSVDLIAENFGLSRNYSGTIQFSPLIQNIIIDFGFYIGLDSFAEGLYFRTHLPFAYTNWNLVGDCRQNSTGCSDDQPTKCVFIDERNQNSTLSAGFVGTSSIAAVSGLEKALSGTATYGDMKYQWNAGAFRFSDQTVGGLADIDLILGYNFVNNDCGRFGLYFQAVMPTGTRPDGKFVFQPIIGNGKHFEVGGGISAMARLWHRNENESIALFLEGNITHMFNDKQCRLFEFNSDLAYSGNFSRYMLLKGFTTSTSSSTGYTYTGELQNAVNILTKSVNVSVDVKADLSLKLAYRNCGFAVDLGYNFYGQSQEKLTSCSDGNNCYTGGCKASGASATLWAPKGTEDVFSPAYLVINRTTLPTPVVQGIAGQGLVYINGDDQQNGGCTNTATIGLPFPPTAGTYVASYGLANSNARFDATPTYAGTPQVMATDIATNCAAAFSTSSPQPTSNALSTLAQLQALGVAQTTAFKSANPQVVNVTTLNTGNLIDQTKIDYVNFCSGAAPSLVSHKVFGHVNYVWEGDCGWDPYLGLGAEAEFTPLSKDNANTVASQSTNITISCNSNCGDNNCRTNYNVWGVWLKGGFSF